MSDPTTPQERRAATAAWRAVPYRMRRQVLAAPRRGIGGLDPAAIAAGRHWAQTVLRPRGPHFWQRFPERLWLRLALPVAMAAETYWLVAIDEVPWSHAWPLPVAAYVSLLLTLLHVGMRRSLRRLVAVSAGPAEGGFSAAPPSSAPPEPGASTPR